MVRRGCRAPAPVPTTGFGAVTRAVEAGDYKRITSIVVARDGRLVYERDFDDGVAEAQRNTRAATRTIAGMLLGLAIADGKLPNAQTPMLPYLGARSAIVNPDPRKAKITFRGQDLAFVCDERCRRQHRPGVPGTACRRGHHHDQLRCPATASLHREIVDGDPAAAR